MQGNPQNVTATGQARKVPVEAAEMDEHGSFVGSKANQRWLWFAIDQAANHVLSYLLGKRTDEVFKYLKDSLEPFNVIRYITDDLFVMPQPQCQHCSLCHSTILRASDIRCDENTWSSS